MDRETETEFKRVWAKMKQYEADSRELIRVSVVLKTLGKKVDRFSFAVTTLAITVVADLIAHYVK